ncbi:uncharacterized protein LOC128556690 [Mercenaria mercenaria]|uniref:uncharacterized protein LOC128556690 n=1 Tax=Mercenaria mercenaria TaxID=6596 RepID=UPI00234E3B27|nr:uncharacterized protein LOC128556690 [Mercenaria mercenaria]
MQLFYLPPEDLSPEELDNVLAHFWMDLKKVDGTSYKINSLESVRHGINRHLKNPPHNKNFDIIKDQRFVKSNTNFKAVCMELKRDGNIDVEHYPRISENDAHQLYRSNIHLDPSTPQGLFNKVQFDIRLYFCRRGNENMYTMTKDTFRVQIDQKTGEKYVKKVDYSMNEGAILLAREK